MRATGQRSEFDTAYNVETDGASDDWTYLSDLDIQSPNWIDGADYSPIEPERFALILAALSNLSNQLEEFVFVDFGSGKGRALLLASEFPFKSIMGLEFSPELHATAERNIRKFSNPRQSCKKITSLCMDFLDFTIPDDPAVLFFYDPCSEKLFSQVLSRVGKSLQGRTSDLYLVYVAPGDKEHLLDSTRFLKLLVRDTQYNFCIYRALTDAASNRVSSFS